MDVESQKISRFAIRQIKIGNTWTKYTFFKINVIVPELTLKYTHWSMIVGMKLKSMAPNFTVVDSRNLIVSLEKPTGKSRKSESANIPVYK